MLLKEDHIAVFQANWDDKATNIRAIAKELALGLDSFVFLDDNPVERGLIRREIPEVAVPELDSDPAGYARTLAAAGYFEAIAFSDEDRARADMYQANARRLNLQGQTSDLQSYLRSLEMRIVFGSFDRTTRSRLTCEMSVAIRRLARRRRSRSSRIRCCGRTTSPTPRARRSYDAGSRRWRNPSVPPVSAACSTSS